MPTISAGCILSRPDKRPGIGRCVLLDIIPPAPRSGGKAQESSRNRQLPWPVTQGPSLKFRVDQSSGSQG